MIIASNFKTNHTRASTQKYISEVTNFVKNSSSKSELIVFPSATSLDKFDTSITIGAQNAYATANGAFTGEIGLDQLDEFEIKTILIGHSERRHVLGETQELISSKFNFYKEQGFKIVYCVGEPLNVREQGNKAILEYIDTQLVGIDLDYNDLIVAYEPVWAIGTGLTPSNEDIELIHSTLKKTIKSPILYGGSVKVNIAKDILSLKSVDGILVGSGALKSEDYIEMIKISDDLA